MKFNNIELIFTPLGLTAAVRLRRSGPDRLRRRFARHRGAASDIPARQVRVAAAAET